MNDKEKVIKAREIKAAYRFITQINEKESI